MDVQEEAESVILTKFENFRNIINAKSKKVFQTVQTLWSNDMCVSVCTYALKKAEGKHTEISKEVIFRCKD